MVIAICDDERLQMEHVAAKLEALPHLKGARILCYDAPGALINDIQARAFALDIAVLDIQMETSGIDIARLINQAYPCCQIVFLTGYLEYAPQAYDVEHTYFMLKSEFDKRIESAVDKALSRLQSLKSRQITVSFNGQVTIRPVSDVLYLERIGHKTVVHCASGEYHTYARPKDVLGEHVRRFIRCHSSFYVNPACIESMAKNQLLLRDGRAVPISRTYAVATRQTLLSSAAESAR